MSPGWRRMKISDIGTISPAPVRTNHLVTDTVVASAPIHIVRAPVTALTATMTHP